MVPDMYLDASVAMVKGEESSERCKTGLERKRHLRQSKVSCWKGVQFQGRFFLAKLMRGQAIVESLEMNCQ